MEGEQEFSGHLQGLVKWHNYCSSCEEVWLKNLSASTDKIAVAII